MDVSGLATWRHLPLEHASAKNKWHVEGVICGVWVKK